MIKTRKAVPGMSREAKKPESLKDLTHTPGPSPLGQRTPLFLLVSLEIA